MQYPNLRLYNIVMAFQQFAGQPLRVMDHAETLSSEQLEAVETCLRALSQSLRASKGSEVDLANNIDEWVA